MKTCLLFFYNTNTGRQLRDKSFNFSWNFGLVKVFLVNTMAGAGAGISDTVWRHWKSLISSLILTIVIVVIIVSVTRVSVSVIR